MNNEKYDESKKKGIFFLIIGILTFCIAILGASFSWFSATATSGDKTLITTGTLTISYTDGSSIVASNLKPATTEQVGEAYANNKCAYASDVTAVQNNETICTVYQFTVTNTGSLYAALTASFSNFEIIDALDASKRTENGNIPVTTATEQTNGYFKYAYADSEPGTAKTFTAAPLADATSITLSNATLSPNGSTTGYIVVWLDSTAGNTYQGISARAGLNITAIQTNK